MGKLFSQQYRYQNTYESNERHHLEKLQVKISLKESISEFEKYLWILIRIRKNEWTMNIPQPDFGPYFDTGSPYCRYNVHVIQYSFFIS
jgi:hypothetical protein